MQARAQKHMMRTPSALSHLFLLHVILINHLTDLNESKNDDPLRLEDPHF